jgi:molybdopterin-guanine dinucleotide biosynthesis protein A
MINDITAVILVGGQSRRIGRDKAFLKIGQRTFLEIIIRKLSGIFGRILISAKDGIKYQALLNPEIKLIRDRYQARGSLVGIYSALKAARTKHIFVIACDMPLVSSGFIRKLIRYRKGYDVVIPQTANGLEPLCAVYSRECLPHIKALLNRTDLKILNFFPKVRVRKVRATGRALFNINTRTDYRKIIRKNT